MAPTLTLAIAAIAESALLRRYAAAHSIKSMIIEAAVLFSAQMLLWLTWSIIIYPFYFSPLRNLPQPKGGSLLMGQLPRIWKEGEGELQREWVDTIPNDGVIYYRYIFNNARVVVTTPKALAEVMVHRNYDFIKPDFVKKSVARILGVGVALAEGDEHKRQRKSLMPAFSFRHIKSLYPVFWTKAKEVTQTMSAAIQRQSEDSEKPSSVLSVTNWASRATLDIIGIAGMGKDFDSVQNPDSELNLIYRKLFAPNTLGFITRLLGGIVPFSVLSRLPIKRNFEVDDAVQKIKRITYDMIEEKKRKLAKGERTDVDVISVALESGSFSADELVNQMMTFLAAGHETTSSSLTWAAYLLCKYPDVQKRLREEIRANLPSPSDSNASITSTDIDRLAYLNAVCNETIRVFPPVPFAYRVAAFDTTIQDHFIPKGTFVILAPWAVNASRELWGDDAEEFKPDRWMGPGCANTGGADSNYSYMTFLHGPRSCMGQGFAKAEFACLLAAWVGRFEMELADPNYELEIFRSSVTVRPSGLTVKFTAVEGW